MTSAVKNEDIAEDLFCPVCFELPENKVFQCRDGHILCKKCYFQLTECPQCREKLGRDHPIRSRLVEKMIEKVPINCAFESSGCKEKFPRASVKSHEGTCRYDFKKFGTLDSLCWKIGYSYCSFKFNNGSTREAVNHFVKEHGFIVTEKGQFRMDLETFNNKERKPGCNRHYWTPLIIDLAHTKCFVLITTVHDVMKDSFSWISVYLPYPDNSNIEKSPVQIEFFIESVENSFISNLCQTPVTLNEARGIFPESIPLKISYNTLRPHCNEKGSLIIKCIVKQVGGQLVKLEEKLETFVCSHNTNSGNFDRWGMPIFKREPENNEVKKFRNRLFAICIEKREALLPYLKLLFEQNWNPLNLDLFDLQWIKGDLMFLIPQYGDLESLKYLVEKEVNFDMIESQHLKGPVHYTILDKDKKIGLEKAKFLIDKGVKYFCFVKSHLNLMYYACANGDEQMVKYFLNIPMDTYLVTPDHSSPLHHAARNNNEEDALKIAKLFIARGDDCNDTDYFEKTPLDYAISKGHRKLQQLLYFNMDISEQFATLDFTGMFKFFADN